VNKKNNWDEIAKAYMYTQRFGSKQVWANQKKKGRGGGVSE